MATRSRPTASTEPAAGSFGHVRDGRRLDLTEAADFEAAQRRGIGTRIDDKAVPEERDAFALPARP